MFLFESNIIRIQKRHDGSYSDPYVCAHSHAYALSDVVSEL